MQIITDKKTRMIDYSSLKAEDFLLDDRFIDYCKNKTNSDFWESLIKNHPKVEPEIKKASQLFEIMSLKTSPEEKEVELNKLKVILSSSHNKHKQPAFIKLKTNFHRFKNFVAAAIILGIIAAGSIWYNTTFNKQNKPQEYSLNQFNTIITAPFDDRREVTLPDGSTVLLNYGSTIKVEDNYNENDRRIFLEGEAFFTVQPNTKRPFTVLTKHSQTNALGTSFKVKDFPGENFSNVKLATGKVRVIPVTKQKEEKEFILLPGKQLTIDQAGNSIPAIFSQQQLTDWKNIQINFESADLATIIREVEYYYGVRMVLQNEPRNQVALTGKFYEKSLKDVLEAVSYTNKLTYTQKQNTVYIHFNDGLK